MGSKPYKTQTINNNIYLIPTNDTYTHTFIWLHGLGDTADGFLDMFNSYESLIPFNVKIILLNAPYEYCSLYDEKTTSWFNIFKKGILDEKSYNYEEVKNNSKKIKDLIEEEVKLLNGKYENIFIGGYSQGGCLSLDIGLSFEKKIGGIIVCSGFLFSQTEINNQNKDINIFIGHGINDNVINIKESKKSFERIENYKNFEYHQYEMRHSICKNEINDFSIFIKKIIDNKSIDK